MSPVLENTLLLVTDVKKQQLAGVGHKSYNKVPATHRHGGQRFAPLPDTYLDKGTQDKEDEI